MTLRNLREEAGGIDAQTSSPAPTSSRRSAGRSSSRTTGNTRLAAYLFRHTKKPIGIVMGVAEACAKLFDERYYADLDGGILESFGRLFKNRPEDLRLPRF